MISRRGYWQPVSVVPPGANAAAVAAAVANAGTAGTAAAAMPGAEAPAGNMMGGKPMEYGAMGNPQGRAGVNPWILN